MSATHNNRIQVFKKDGTFVKEWFFFEKNTAGNGALGFACGPIQNSPIAERRWRK